MSRTGPHRALLASCWLVAVICGLGGVARGAEPLFTAEFADGNIIAGGHLQDWHDTSAQPKLNGAALLDPGRPMRWLWQQSSEAPAAPPAFVELVGGDRLPGRAVEYRSGRETSDRAPPHVLVTPDVSVEFPGQSPRESVRVRVGALRRVVWRRRGADRYVPGTLFFVNGREVRYRSLRWLSDGVSVLLADGPRRVPFAEIGELHLPQRDVWDAYYETLAVLSPNCDTRLLQVETTGGLVATTSLSRLRAQTRSGGDQNNWFHLVQPAWSLDPLWLPHMSIVWRRLWQSHEVPLSIVPPERIAERSMLGRGWTWQLNASVRGAPLRSGGKLFGWGLGTQAYCEMAFALPPTVKAFRTRVALDEAAGPGGCARGAVFVNEAGARPLYQTKHLIGEGDVVDSGAISLAGPAGGQKTLVLVSDPAHVDRPAGADPFDIRDHLDWLEPMLELDPEKLFVEVQSRIPQTIAAWDDWKLVQVPPGRLRIFDRWDGPDPQSGQFRSDVVASGAPLRLEREVNLSPRQTYLAISCERQPGRGPSQVQVQIGGQTVAEFAVSEARRDHPQEVRLVPLQKFRGSPVKLAVVHFPRDEQGAVEWRLLDFQEHLTSTNWQPLDLKEVSSSAGTKLTGQVDGSVLATGANPGFDEYTVVAETHLTGITALRLDVLDDVRLPQHGPGRAASGAFRLSDFAVTVAAPSKPDEAEAVEFSGASADFADPTFPIAAAIDNDKQASAWSTSQRPGQPHVAVFTTRQDIGFAGGTRLTFRLNHHLHHEHNIGRFRLSATNAPRPVPAERNGIVWPLLTPGVLVLFEDQPEFGGSLNEGGGKATWESTERYSGNYCVRVEGGVASRPRLGDLAAKIREQPAADEFRYLRFAWKKVGGNAICMQLCHDGHWGPVGPLKFRYQAGSGPEFSTGALLVERELPERWTLVTRDLFADFGEFVFTGLSLVSVDGQAALFDHILLGRSLAELDAVQ